ncbi:hypothetical protein BC834DRAFT_905663 [Gloeopeniophorella convolvens]|nr:hypothetical protein BC834DRAFT_905663 [Gloeopeniophorella convolvens]
MKQPFRRFPRFFPGRYSGVRAVRYQLVPAIRLLPLLFSFPGFFGMSRPNPRTRSGRADIAGGASGWSVDALESGRAPRMMLRLGHWRDGIEGTTARERLSSCRSKADVAEGAGATEREGPLVSMLGWRRLCCWKGGKERPGRKRSGSVERTLSEWDHRDARRGEDAGGSESDARVSAVRRVHKTAEDGRRKEPCMEVWSAHGGEHWESPGKSRSGGRG